MKKNKLKNEPMVRTDVEGRKSEKGRLSSVGRYATESNEARKPEKLWLVGYFTVRRHSRVLYLPLDATAVRLHGIEKGDIVKAVILELRKAPRPDEPIPEVSESKPDEGEL